MIVKRLVFVFLFLATLFGLVGTAVAQSGATVVRDLGVRGDLGDWERLLGAQATAPRSA